MNENRSKVEHVDEDDNDENERKKSFVVFKEDVLAHEKVIRSVVYTTG